MIKSQPLAPPDPIRTFSGTIALIVPSLKTGGMERVATVLANYYAEHTDLKVCLITLSDQGVAYEVHPDVQLRQPAYDLTRLSFLDACWKAVTHLRKTFRELRPDSALSFGDRYNAFVILSSLGFKMKVFVSNRMRPSASNGWKIDLLNKILYPLSSGIVAQTEAAKSVFLKRYLQPNITAIGNPFPLPESVAKQRAKMVLNVGRFNDEKNQHLLVRYFNELNTEGWELIFLGDGPKREKTDEELKRLKKGKKVVLAGTVKPVDPYYERSSIFAFTSTTEGFPNALGEAMSFGCACISFDCETGPSELIDDGQNGFLVPVGDHEQYKRKLQQLLDDPDLRRQFSAMGREKMKQFELAVIARKYLAFILGKAAKVYVGKR